MIHDQKAIYHLVREHVFNDYNYKLRSLDEALNYSLRHLLEYLCGGAVHLAFSGGVDSALILMKLLHVHVTVVAHTLGSDENHPDVIAARAFHKKVGGFEHVVTLVGEPVLTKPYSLLMKHIRNQGVDQLICCDVADELFGGYYSHQEPKRKLTALKKHMSRLLLYNLVPLEIASTCSGVEVFLPYADQEVFLAASLFSPEQLVTDTKRKRPICDLAKQYGVPRSIINRRKYGLDAVGQRLQPQE